MKIIYRGMKYRIYPTNEQAFVLRNIIGGTRFVWNNLLETNNKLYREQKKFLWYMAGNQRILELKVEFPWLKTIPSQSLQLVSLNLEIALKRYLNPKLKNEYPTFKKKRNGGSFTVPQHFKIGSRTVEVPNLKPIGRKINRREMELFRRIRLVKHRDLEGKPKSITIRYQDGQWYCSVLVEIKRKATLTVEQKKRIGLDLGLKTVIVTSENQKIEAPLEYYKEERKLARAQKVLSRRVKGSKRYWKQNKRLNKISSRVTSIRKDWVHQTVHHLITKNDVVVVEDLNIEGMKRHKNWGKKVSDLGLGRLISVLKYKAEDLGKRVIVVGRWYPSTKRCSRCGNIKEVELEERVYICPLCGLNIDRDYNAALNILAEGSSVIARGGTSTGGPTLVDRVGSRHVSVETRKKILTVVSNN